MYNGWPGCCNIRTASLDYIILHVSVLSFITLSHWGYEWCSVITRLNVIIIELVRLRPVCVSMEWDQNKHCFTEVCLKTVMTYCRTVRGQMIWVNTERQCLLVLFSRSSLSSEQTTERMYWLIWFYNVSKCLPFCSQSSSPPYQTERIYWPIWVFTDNKCLLAGFRRVPHCTIRLHICTGWSGCKCLLVGCRREPHGRVRLYRCAGWSGSMLAVHAYSLAFTERKTVRLHWTDVLADIVLNCQ